MLAVSVQVFVIIMIQYFTSQICVRSVCVNIYVLWYIHILRYICRLVHTCIGMVHTGLSQDIQYLYTCQDSSPTSHPTLPSPPRTHSPHTTVQPPHSIPSAPHNLIPSPSAQTLINTSTSKSDINPPQSQEHTAVSQHGYPYAVLISDSLSITSSITMPVLQDTGLLLISVMLFMQGRCRVVVEWSPRNPLMLKLSEGG